MGASSEQTISKPPPLGIFKILNEAVKLPIKNLTLILPVLVLSFVSSSFLFAFTYFYIDPISAHLTAISTSITQQLDPKNPEAAYALMIDAVIKDLRELAIVEAIFIPVSLIVSSLIAIATLHALFLASTNSCKLSTRHDLLRRLGIKGLKGPIITILYVKLMNILYFSLLLLPIFAIYGLIIIGYKNYSVAVIASGVILGVLAVTLYLYLALLWSVSVAISVDDDNNNGTCTYGLEAISKASKMLKGRKRRAFGIIRIQILISALASAVFYVLKSCVPPNSAIPQFGMGVVNAAFVALAGVFGWAVIVVFYCDCKRCDVNGQDVGGFTYDMVPTADRDDQKMAAALP